MARPFIVGTLGNLTVVEFQSPALISALELEPIGRALSDLVDERPEGTLLLDFTIVQSMSSQAIGILVSLHKKKSQIKGGKLMLCGVCPNLMKLMKLTRMDQVLRIVKDQQAAVEKA